MSEVAVCWGVACQGGAGVQDATKTQPDTLKERYQLTMERVARAAERSGRRASDILVVAVSKYAELDDVRELIEMGHRDFGESRPQQLSQRVAMISEWIGRRERFTETAKAPPVDPVSGTASGDVRWHMIGRLQRNKVRKLLPDVRLIHSVDSMRLAEELQMAALKREAEVDGLLQVNVAGEDSKTGLTPPAAPHVAEQIDTMTFLRLRGMMMMAPLVENAEETRPVFEMAKAIFDDIRTLELCEGKFNILSMGMTNDFEVAIESGSNCVRIGSAIFGGRASDDSDDQDD